MNIFKKLFKCKKGNELVEKIMIASFAIAAGSAVILYTSNVIIEAKNKNVGGVLPADGVVYIDESQATSGLLYTLSGGNYYVSGYEGTSPTVTVPSIHNGKNVNAIGQSAFKGNTTITSVSLPSEVKKIDRMGFYQCSNLLSISMPGVERLEYLSLGNCTKMTTAPIPTTIKYIGEGAFNQANKLSEINLQNVTSMGTWAFAACYPVQTLSIPRSLTALRASDFAACTGLKTVYIPSTLTSMERNVFDMYNSNVPNMKFYCEATEKPAGWDSAWLNRAPGATVYWGATLPY